MPKLMCLITFHLCSKIVQCLQAFSFTARPDTKKIVAQREPAAEYRHFKSGLKEAAFPELCHTSAM